MVFTKSNILNAISLFMVIVIDVMGIVLVFPVLTPLILQPDSVMISVQTSAIARDLIYGVTLSLFPFFMFFSAPVLGDLSDKFGRKKILLVCMLGTSLSYFISAFGIIESNLGLLMVGRVIAGLSAGTQPIATAAIVDMSTSETKTRNLSWIVLAASIGVILGPIIGGITADKTLASWFSYQVPFLVAGILALINAIMLFYTFKDVTSKQEKSRIHLTKGFFLFIGAFADGQFRLLSLTYFCFLLAWSLYFQTIGWLFMVEHQYTALNLGIFMGFIGVIFTLSTSIVVKRALQMFVNEINTFIFFIAIMVLSNIGAALVQGVSPQWWLVIFNATSNAVCYTVCLTLFSNLVDEKSQGWIMGVASSMCAVVWAIGCLIVGPLGYISLRTPFWVAALLSLFSFALMFVYRQRADYHIQSCIKQTDAI